MANGMTREDCFPIESDVGGCQPIYVFSCDIEGRGIAVCGSHALPYGAKAAVRLGGAAYLRGCRHAYFAGCE